MATSINLAPGTQQIVELRRRRQRLFVISAVVAGITAVAWGILFLYHRQLVSQEKTIQEHIDTVQRKISSLDTDAQRIIAFEERLNDLGALLDAHVSWDPLLADFERLLPPATVITSLDASIENKKIALTGVTPDVDQVALTLASLQNSPGHKTVFTNVAVSAINRNDTKAADGSVAATNYGFTAELQFEPNTLFVNKIAP